MRTTASALHARWQYRFGAAVRFVVAPLVLFFSGFFTADFALSGLYTWPRSSRILVLTLTVCVLAYEFVYKEQREQADLPQSACLKTLLYSCVVPYLAGVVVLVGLSRLASGSH